MAKKQTKKPFLPEDIRKISFVSDPMVHPDDDRIAYVLRKADKDPDQNRYQAELRIMDRSGKGNRPLTSEGVNSEAPLWAPNGKSLLFLSKRGTDKARQIYLLPTDGGEARRLTEGDGGVVTTAWSPDGRKVAYSARVDELEKERKDKPFANDVHVIEQALWRLNGIGSWLDKRIHLFVIGSRGEHPTQLTDGAWNVGGPFPVTEAFTFSADGRKVYFIAPSDPEDDWSAARRMDIFQVGLDGKNRRKMTSFPGMLSAVRVHPDGSLLAIGNDLEKGWASPHRLWRINPSTGSHEPIVLSEDLSLGDAMNCDVRFPSRSNDPWISPDGTHARVRITQRGTVRLAEVSLDSGEITWLSPDDRSVLGWHSTAEGSFRTEIRSTVTEMPELWSVDERGTERRLTRHNDRLLASRKVYPAKPIHYKASDGAEVEAWIQAPSGKTSKGRPAVLGIHGGPKTVYGHAFLIEFQMLAGAGMAVVFGNPRGSDGYGTDWAHAVHGHYGERDYDDLMESVDRAVSEDNVIDAKRLGVSGGSYGGYMTNWIIGQTQRFKAAVSQRGISNWTSMFGTSDIGFFFNPDNVGGYPWSDKKLYEEKSPLTYVENIHTPLLLIHSEQDLRCPIEQSEQLFVFLKRLGREVRFARFPGETHELSRSGTPNRRMERLRLILDWFKEKL
jgi:dipeptidyl aminopeptidase/acylaminoacyl peptidase